jgi:hypothetical protein
VDGNRRALGTFGARIDVTVSHLRLTRTGARRCISKTLRASPRIPSSLANGVFLAPATWSSPLLESFSVHAALTFLVSERIIEKSGLCSLTCGMVFAAAYDATHHY